MFKIVIVGATLCSEEFFFMYGGKNQNASKMSEKTWTSQVIDELVMEKSKEKKNCLILFY